MTAGMGGATPIVSIIIPVFNAEETLAAAVASVQAQTEQNWELLLIDDASSDGSAALCDRLAAEDGRIRVFHLLQNGGAGPARNDAIENAAGEYIFMMDADDTIDATLLETALSAIAEHDVHTVVWGLTEEYVDADGRISRSIPVTAPETVARTPDEVHATLLGLEARTLFGYGTNKLYRRDVLQAHGILSPNEPLYEDFFFNVAYAPHITSLVVLPTAPYHYYKRGEGLTARFVPRYFELSARRVKTMWALCREWGMTGEEHRRVLGNIYVRYILSALQRNCDPKAGMDKAARRAFLTTLYDEPLFCELVPHAAPEGAVAAMLCRLIKGRHTAAALAAGRVIYWVKTRVPALFMRASH